MQQAVLEERKKREQHGPVPVQNSVMLLAILAAGFLLSAGCQPKGQDVETPYTPYFDQSLNGTTVFREMCEKSGHRVGNGGALAEKSDYEVLVWFSSDPDTPPQKTLDTLDNWLDEKPDRTIVCVGRAFESTRDYWEKMHSRIDRDDDKKKIKAKQTKAETELNRFLAKKKNPLLPDKEKKNKDPKERDNTLFAMSPLTREYKVQSLAGSENWLRDIEQDNVRFSLFEEMTPAKIQDQETAKDDSETEDEAKEEPAVFEVVLESDGHWIVASTKRKQGRMILVNNGGFLLNYQLVNHEHRKLANRLIHEFGDTSKKVFLLYSSHEIHTYLPGDRTYQSSFDVVLKFLQVWPISILFWQCILIGILFCFYKWPVLGRPRKLPRHKRVDFSEHISAYADLLSATGEEIYIRKQVQQFRKNQGEEPPEKESENHGES